MSALIYVLLGCGGLDAFTANLDARDPNALGRGRDAVTEVLLRAEGLPDDVRREKLCALSSGAFPFYRATAHLFYADLAQAPELAAFSGPLTWLSGDAHPQNFGAFADDEGRIVYDLNDFDESFVGDARASISWATSSGSTRTTGSTPSR
ncbi:MAG: DUF2252 family protein [Alphaproteobacteria bacterium]|nr:DUF2252 family protein [Alphaproteobacteria bacterium]